MGDLDKAQKLLRVWIEEGNTEQLLQTLVRYPELKNLKDTRGVSLLGLALKNHHYQISEYLVAKGADINSRNNAHQSLLFIAAANNDIRGASFLLEKGADINIADFRGWTPLMIAAKNGHKSMIEFLLQFHPDLSICDKFGKSVHEKAGNSEIAAILKEYSRSSRFLHSSPKLSMSSEMSPSSIQNSPQTRKDVIKSISCRERKKLDLLIRAFIKKIKGKLKDILIQQIKKDFLNQLEGSYSILRDFLQEEDNMGITQAMKKAVKKMNTLFQILLAKFEIKDRILYTITEADVLSLMEKENTFLECVNNEFSIKPKNYQTSRSPESDILIKPETGTKILTSIAEHFELLHTDLSFQLNEEITYSMERSVNNMKLMFRREFSDTFKEFEKSLEGTIEQLTKERMVRLVKQCKDNQKAKEKKNAFDLDQYNKIFSIEEYQQRLTQI